MQVDLWFVIELTGGYIKHMHKKAIVHIGFHKTATTWFQNVFYPSVINGHFIERDIARMAIIEPRAFDFNPETARTILTNSTTKRPIICEENLSGYLHNGGLGGLLSKAIADRLVTILPDAQIVIFIRSQPDVIAASYAQYVKGGGTFLPNEYIFGQSKRSGALKHWYKAPYFSIDHFKYSSLIEYYISLFGKSQVHIFLYEDFLNNSSEFIYRFCSILELKILPD
jgi:hypothetical protein